MIYSYNSSQRDALFLKFILIKTLHVSDRFTVHHQECSTSYTAIGICHTGYVACLLADRQHNQYDRYLLLCMQYYTPDDGQ